MRSHVFVAVFSLAALSAACGKSTTETATLQCSGLPTLSPTTVPRLRPGNSVNLSVASNCSPTPTWHWKSSDTTIVKLSSSLGASTVALGREAGVATVSVYAQEQTSFGTSVAITVADTAIVQTRPAHHP